MNEISVFMVQENGQFELKTYSKAPRTLEIWNALDLKLTYQYIKLCNF